MLRIDENILYFKLQIFKESWLKILNLNCEEYFDFVSFIYWDAVSVDIQGLLAKIPTG
jgi:hypothetical protein